jgi:cytoskeleton protein RodZ
MTKTAEAQADSVGALLRQSRELKGLTTADVATHLRLKVSQIEQIEAEQWDPAVSATFMRGYLRAYARLLKLSEKEILQNFELQAAYLRNQAKPMHSFSKKNRLDAVDNRFMLATYLLVVLLIGLFLIWFWQTHLLDSQPVSVLPEYRVSGEPATVQSSATPADVVSAQPTATELATSTAEVTSNQTNVPAAVTSNPAETVAPPTADPLVTSPAVTNQTQTNEIVAADATPTTDQVTSPSANAAPVTTENQVTTDVPAALPTEPSVAASTAQLQLTFSAECWVTVQDATGKRLAYGIQSAGQSLQLTGQLPFSVTLGNAAAATVQLNQTAVDLSGYRAGQVARLTLDGQP